MTCALPPVDMAVAQLGWSDGYFLAPRGTRDAPPIYHPGIDFMADAGGPVIAALGGTVIFKGYQAYGDVLPGLASRDGLGHYVVIDHGTLPGGFSPIVTVYASLQAESPLEVGRAVNQGELVGRVGSSGRSSGDRPYLFFKVMRRAAAGNDYRSRSGLSPLRDFFEPLGVTRIDAQSPGPPVSPYNERPPWGGTLVQADRCGAGLSALSPSRIQSKYNRYGSTQLSSRSVYHPALYAEGSPGLSGGTLLGLAAVAGGVVYLATRRPAAKAPPWWVRQQRWRSR